LRGTVGANKYVRWKNGVELWHQIAWYNWNEQTHEKNHNDIKTKEKMTPVTTQAEQHHGGPIAKSRPANSNFPIAIQQTSKIVELWK
jgi:hypothetical protein